MPTPDPTATAFLDRPLICVGGGNMAHAILSRAVPAGACPGRTIVVDPNEPRRALFSEAFESLDGAFDAIGNTPFTLLLAVKPQVFPDIARLLRERAERGNPVAIAAAVSIMAGVRADTIGARLPGSPPVVRVMPNTPAQIGEGMAAIAPTPGVSSDDLASVRGLFQAMGRVIDIPETQMDAFTALAGSGPAYLFYLAEAMTRAGVEMGFDEPDAQAIAAQTVRGAAMLLSDANEPPEALRARVTSRKGTTAAACERLDELGVMGSVIDAIKRAEARGRELAAE